MFLNQEAVASLQRKDGRTLRRRVHSNDKPLPIAFIVPALGNELTGQLQRCDEILSGVCVHVLVHMRSNVIPLV